MTLKLCVLSVLFLTGLCEARIVASRIDCLSDPCFRSSLTECAGQLIIRQPARRALKIAKRRCSKQLVAQCRRTGTMPFCGDDTSNPPPSYPPDDSPGGA